MRSQWQARELKSMQAGHQKLAKPGSGRVILTLLGRQAMSQVPPEVSFLKSFVKPKVVRFCKLGNLSSSFKQQGLSRCFALRARDSATNEILTLGRKPGFALGDLLFWALCLSGLVGFCFFSMFLGLSTKSRKTC